MKIITIPGSLRAGSYNRKLIALANELLLKRNVDLEALDLRDFPLPLYDGDFEEQSGLPESAAKLKAKLASAHGIIIASPEYNGGISGMFKNTIDWTSRGKGNPWTGKVVGLMGTTPGMWGTLRGMPQIRQVMSALSAHVIPQQINLPHAAKVLDEEGNLLDEKLAGRVEKFIDAFLSFCGRSN